MTEFELTTPVAFLIFNRPDTTERVFSEIARARPPILLVIGDGPRTSRLGEGERVAAAREVIRHVDWECRVLTNLSDDNMGCRNRVSSGLDWVFEQVEEAIILEDDCLPHPTFFRFCQEMLERYRDDQRIGMISGDNFQFGYETNDDSYYFSKYIHIWGWATWRDRWKNNYDVTLAGWPKVRDESRWLDFGDDPREARRFADWVEDVYCGRLDTWDVQWMFASEMNHWMSIIPRVNLVSNIGFGIEATHTTVASPMAKVPLSEMSFPLVHPPGIIRGKRLDRRFHEKFMGAGPLSRIKKRAARLVGKMSG